MTDSPAKTRKKTLMRTVRMSEEEFELFGEFCRAQGVTPSEALRRLARSAALLGPTFSGEARAEVVALTRQMRSIGNNLNQAVHRMNAGHVIQADGLKSYLDSVQTAMGHMDRLYSSLCVRSYQRAAKAVQESAS